MVARHGARSNKTLTLPPLRDKYAKGQCAMAVPKVTVVIPAMNEAENLPHVLARLPEWIYEVVLVDGNSSDGTAEVARKVYPNVRVIQQTGKGKGNALREGFAAATGDIMVTLDADGSMDPVEMHSFVGALMAGADYARGSRFLQGGGTADMESYRVFGNLTFRWLVKFLYGGKFTDLCYGYNAMWRQVLPKLNLTASGFEVETVMHLSALRARIKIVEVPSFEYKRIHGQSHLKSFPDGWKVLKTIVKTRFSKSDANLDEAPLSNRPELNDNAAIPGD